MSSHLLVFADLGAKKLKKYERLLGSLENRR